MPVVKISAPVEYEMEDYIQGDTFLLELDFYEDDKATIPENVSGMTWFMDIVPIIENCINNQQQVETLSIGNGIQYGSTTNSIVISKILTSPPGSCKQSIRSVNGSIVKTRERGTLKITAKV